MRDELQSILKKFDYQTALKWFNDHVEGKFFVKEMLSSGEDDFNRARLKKELHQVLESMASPERSRREQIGRERSQSEQNQSQKPNTPPSPIKVTENAAPTSEALQLKEKWRPLYSHAANVFARLDYIQDDEERKKSCFEILDTMDEVQTIWAEADYIKEYGQKPDFGDKGMDDMTPEQMATRIRTLRTYISKAKKGKLNAENIPTWEAEKQELERRMKQ